MNVIERVLQYGAVLAIVAGLFTVLLLATGHSPLEALRAMLNGAFGNWYQFTSVTLVRATPLVFTGLAVSVAFKAGVLNIGAEGQLISGAAAAAAIAALIGNAGAIAIPILLLVGCFAGAMWASIAAWLKYRFGVLEVISTIMLNFIALNVVGWLVRGPLQEPLRIYPQSPALPQSLHLPTLLPGSRLHAGVIGGLLLVVMLWYWISNYASGFRVQATGVNANAAEVSGQINVRKVGFQVFVVSGAIAGLAGAVEYTGVTYALYENFSPGYGYTAIAVALLARLNMLAVLITALFFGALDAGANAMQRDAGVPNVVVNVINALLILAVLAADRWRNRLIAAEQGT